MTASLLLLSLGLPAIMAADPNSARVEFDVVFPRNTTYNNMTTPPIVFAMQNAPTAVFWQYTFSYKLESDNYFYLSGSFDETNLGKKFNYTSDKTALLVDSAYWGQDLEPATYTLNWDFSTSTCTDQGDSTLIQTGKVASGELYFTVVGDGSGSDLSFTECPVYLGNVTAETADDSCPSLVKNGGAPQPCNSKLNDNQVSCLESYFKGETDMSACKEAFDDIKDGDKVVWRYADKAKAVNSSAGDSTAPSSGSASGSGPDSLRDSGDESSSDEPSSDESGDAGDGSLGSIHRPHVWGLAALVMMFGALFS